MSKELGIKNIGKISVKTLGFDQTYLTKLVIEDKPGAVRDLFIVTGDITGVKTGVHAEYGPWVKFLGNMAATDRNGEINRSGELLLPNVISPILHAHFEKAKRDDIKNGTNDFQCIRIEYEINVERTDRSYKFGCKNLNKDAAQNDEMAQRLATLVEENKKLPTTKKK